MFYIPVLVLQNLYQDLDETTAMILSQKAIQVSFILAPVALALWYLFSGGISLLDLLHILLFVITNQVLLIISRLIVRNQSRLNALIPLHEAINNYDSKEKMRLTTRRLKAEVSSYLLKNRSRLHRPLGKDQPLLQTVLLDNLVSMQENLDTEILSDIMRKDTAYTSYERILHLSENQNMSVPVMQPQMDTLLERIQVSDVLGTNFQTTFESSADIVMSVCKRFIDSMLVLFALPVILPLALLIATGIKLTSRGPVIVQDRRTMFKGGPVFNVLKFRTTKTDAESGKKIATRFGKFLEKYTLDDIPQFINVLRGEMSIIGPRPVPVSEFKKMNGELSQMRWYKGRAKAKPGMTGLWQISGRKHLSFQDMCLLDLYYVDNHSFWLDLKILFGTVPAVLSGRGAY
jgi:lipopolysaccharide/colanic/teichoic acid biosynthesis glycosyltransferase